MLPRLPLREGGPGTLVLEVLLLHAAEGLAEGVDGGEEGLDALNTFGANQQVFLDGRKLPVGGAPEAIQLEILVRDVIHDCTHPTTFISAHGSAVVGESEGGRLYWQAPEFPTGGPGRVIRHQTGCESLEAAQPPWKHWQALAVLAAVAFLVYAPFLTLPPMVDDYGHTRLAERYGPPQGWGELFRDPLYRCRATSLWLTLATLQLAGFPVAAFHLTSVALHVLNAWLVYGLGACRWIGWRVAGAAALVFAANERPHEAVIWYASIHEPLVFAFAVGAVLAWLRWLEGGRQRWLAAVAAAWALALLSKESGVVLAVVLPAAALLYPGRRKAAVWALAAGLVSTAGYFWLAWAGQAQHQHFHDGTFEPGWHFVTTMARSVPRGLGLWGGLAVAALVWRRQRATWRAAALAAVWYVAALLPYAFLTYMPRIPSRHHYLASGGMALLAGLGAVAALGRFQRPRAATAALAAAFLAHNALYLGLYKRPQFVKRAEVTEGLVRMVAEHPGERVLLRCPLLPLHEARLALHYRLGLDPGGLLTEDEGDGAEQVYTCGLPPRKYGDPGT